MVPLVPLDTQHTVSTLLRSTQFMQQHTPQIQAVLSLDSSMLYELVRLDDEAYSLPKLGGP